MAMATATISDRRHFAERQSGQLHLLGFVQRQLRGTATSTYNSSLYPSALAAANDCPVFDRHVGRCGTVLQLAAKRAAGRTGRGTGSTETGGVYAQRGDEPIRRYMAVTPKHRRDLLHPLGERVVQGGVLQPDQRHVLDYPTQSNTAPSNALSATGTNNANYNSGQRACFTDPTNYLTPVGAFASSPGPYGTYDMGGDVWQWNEGTLENMCHIFARWGFWCHLPLHGLLVAGNFREWLQRRVPCGQCPRALHHRTLARLCRLPVRFRLATATRKNWPSAVELIAAGFPVLSAGRSMARPTQPEPVA